MQRFARREFQLVLLRRMADFQPELVAAAREELEASPDEYMLAHNRWQSLLHAPRAPQGLRLYQAVLGPPDRQREVPFGEVIMTACTWRLPGLWPDLRWEVMVGVNDVVLDGALVRADDVEVPELPVPAGLAPWSCVVGDVVTRFPDARQQDPDVPSRWLIEVGGDQLWFVYGLLQAVRVGGDR